MTKFQTSAAIDGMKSLRSKVEKTTKRIVSLPTTSHHEEADETHNKVAALEYESPCEATITFKKLTTDCLFLNEGYISVNGELFRFQNSDAPAGKELQVKVLVDADVVNKIDVQIYTTIRTGQLDGKVSLNYDSKLDGFHRDQVSLLGRVTNNIVLGRAAIVEETSFHGTTRLKFAFEDLHNVNPYKWKVDYDYIDYNFEVSVPSWVPFEFGGKHFGGLQ